MRNVTLPLVGLSLLIALAGVVVPTSAHAKKATKGESGGVAITWLGHAAFEIVSPNGTRVLIDPFVKGNPKTPAAYADLSRYGKPGTRPSLILVTHSHGDHKGQAEEIAKKSNAPIVASAELAYSLKVDGKLKKAMNVGGKLQYEDVTVHLVPAMHGSSPGGRPVGFVIEIGKERIYHSGDTWIFGDMELIQLIHKPTILLLNAGGGPFTQDPPTAALAVKRYFKPKHIVPMHFGTFPVLADEADVKKAFGKDKRLTILTPGTTKRF